MVCLVEEDVGGNQLMTREEEVVSVFFVCFSTSRMRENVHWSFERCLLYFFVSDSTSLNCVLITFLWKLFIITIVLPN